MCGIAGVYEAEGGAARADQLLAMAGELRHRGPDGTGLYLDGRVGMANTRLSVLDLAGGDQPIGTEDGRFWVVQNGEIFNHAALRAELEAKGHVFATNSDTEVLAHGYEEWGEQLLPRLNGEFAFAVWDRATATLFLARDRFGVRPMFLSEHGGALRFASEAKALLRTGDVARAIDPLALVEAFALWAPAPDRSVFAGIRELPPGCWLRLDRDGRRTEQSWWDLCFANRCDQLAGDPSELAEELARLLADATRLRLQADVPVGVYLSGGLDSSAIAAFARRAHAGPLRAFALRFADRRFDEREPQDAVAAALDTDLATIEVDDGAIATAFREAVRLGETPLLRTAPAPLLLLSRCVREHGCKVVLTGEGADELFAGYDLFREAKVRRFWARQPDSRARPELLRRLYPYLAQDLGRTGDFLLAFFGQGLRDTDDPLYSHRLRLRNGRRVVSLLAPDLLQRAAAAGDPEERLRRRLPPAFATWSHLAQAQYLESRTFLEGHLLHAQGDRMLMGNAVEGRFPFLDHRVAEFALRLPDRMRLCGMTEKRLLRRAVAPMLPATIAQRPKRPYRAPILRAFLGPGAPAYVAELLAPRRLADAGLFDAAAVGRLLDKCRRQLERGVSENDEMALVGVVSTMLLHDHHVAHPALAAPLTPDRLVVGANVVADRTRPR
jgi:asparagine synthase (glutamine-hydrolysing)